MCFPQGEGFPEAMPTAPAIPGPIPKPFEGVMLEGGGGRCAVTAWGCQSCHAPGRETSEAQCGGEGFAVYFIIGFLVGWETTAKTTKEQPRSGV